MVLHGKDAATAAAVALLAAVNAASLAIQLYQMVPHGEDGAAAALLAAVSHTV
jgi:hypothetical protein